MLNQNLETSFGNVDGLDPASFPQTSKSQLTPKEDQCEESNHPSNDIEESSTSPTNDVESQNSALNFNSNSSSISQSIVELLSSDTDTQPVSNSLLLNTYQPSVDENGQPNDSFAFLESFNQLNSSSDLSIVNIPTKGLDMPNLTTATSPKISKVVSNSTSLTAARLIGQDAAVSAAIDEAVNCVVKSTTFDTKSHTVDSATVSSSSPRPACENSKTTTTATTGVGASINNFNCSIPKSLASLTHMFFNNNVLNNFNLNYLTAQDSITKRENLELQHLENGRTLSAKPSAMSANNPSNDNANQESNVDEPSNNSSADIININNNDNNINNNNNHLYNLNNDFSHLNCCDSEQSNEVVIPPPQVKRIVEEDEEYIESEENNENDEETGGSSLEDNDNNIPKLNLSHEANCDPSKNGQTDQTDQIDQTDQNDQVDEQDNEQDNEQEYEQNEEEDQDDRVSKFKTMFSKESERLKGEVLVKEEEIANGFVFLTNYRVLLFLEQNEVKLSIPICLIENTLIRESLVLYVHTKQGRTIHIRFIQVSDCFHWQNLINDAVSVCGVNWKTIFSFKYHRALKSVCKSEEVNGSEPDTMSVMEKEYERLNFGTLSSTGEKLWKLSKVNENFEICTSYPRYIIVPEQMNNETLGTVANFRVSGRLPAIVWRSKQNGRIIARSSQPEVGIWSSNRSDQELLKLIVDNTMDEECPNSKLLVLDARSYTAAFVNRAKGGGYECAESYFRCETQFMGLANIHTIRSSFISARAACEFQTTLKR